MTCGSTFTGFDWVPDPVVEGFFKADLFLRLSTFFPPFVLAVLPFLLVPGFARPLLLILSVALAPDCRGLSPPSRFILSLLVVAMVKQENWGWIFQNSVTRGGSYSLERRGSHTNPGIQAGSRGQSMNIRQIMPDEIQSLVFVSVNLCKPFIGSCVLLPCT